MGYMIIFHKISINISTKIIHYRKVSEIYEYKHYKIYHSVICDEKFIPSSITKHISNKIFCHEIMLLYH